MKFIKRDYQDNFGMNGVYKTLKIRGREYKIFKGDVFADNGSCIQVLSQYFTTRGNMTSDKNHPILTKKMSKELDNLFDFKVLPWGNINGGKLYIVESIK